MIQLNEIEDSIQRFMEISIESMNTHFALMRKSLSPLVR